MEIFWTLKHFETMFLQEIFELLFPIIWKNQNNPVYVRPRQEVVGSKILRSIGPQICDGLPNEIKLAENLEVFKLLDNGTASATN